MANSQLLSDDAQVEEPEQSPPSSSSASSTPLAMSPTSGGSWASPPALKSTSAARFTSLHHFHSRRLPSPSDMSPCSSRTRLGQRSRKRTSKARLALLCKSRKEGSSSVGDQLLAYFPDIDSAPFTFRMGVEQRFVISNHGWRREMSHSVPQKLSLPDVSTLELAGDKPFRFLDLPFDIRRMIYDLFFKWDRNIRFNIHRKLARLCNSGAVQSPMPPKYSPVCSVALMQTCKAIYHEASATLYGDNCFEIFSPSYLTDANNAIIVPPVPALLRMPVCTANLKHLILHHVPCRTNELIGPNFQFYFVKIMTWLGNLPMLIDAVIEFELQEQQQTVPATEYDEAQALRPKLPMAVIEDFLEAWSTARKTRESDRFILGGVQCVRGMWRGGWVRDTDEEVYTVCMPLVRDGHASPTSHSKMTEITKHGRWKEEERKIVQGVECVAFMHRKHGTR
jgi:hypothetical protein